MANLSATIAALNSMLASQERRLQTDVQASLAAMDLGLKERSRKDLKEFRRRTLADQEVRTGLMSKEQRDKRRAQRATEFHKNKEEIQKVITLEKIDFANDIWSTMFSATYDKIVGGSTKIDSDHHKKMQAYLQGSDVSFSEQDAKRIGRAILSYGSWTADEQVGKPTKIMLSLARYMGNRSADPTKNAHFMTAAFNAGMMPSPLDTSKSGLNNMTNAKVFYGKARELDSMQRDLDRETEELDFVSTLGTEELRYAEENKIKYDFNAPLVQALKDYKDKETEEDADPGKGAGALTAVLKNITTQSYTPITETDKGKKEMDRMIALRDAGDTSYRNTQAFLDLNPYFQGQYDAEGKITGVNVQRMIGANLDQTAGAFDYDMATPERLTWNEQTQYDFQEGIMMDLGNQISDARGTIKKMNDDMALMTENAQREGVTTLPAHYQNMEITRFKEEERLAYLETEQMNVYQQVAERTMAGKDEWWAGMNERAMRDILPGEFVTQSERKARRSGNVAINQRTGMINLPSEYEKARGDGGSLSDYLGASPYPVLAPKAEDVGKANVTAAAYNPNSFMNTMKRGLSNMNPIEGLTQTMDLLTFKPPYKR